MTITVTGLLVKVRAETAGAMASLGTLSAGLVGLGAIAGGVAAASFVKMGMDAQTQLAIVQGLTGSTAAQMQFYTTQLEAMGTQLGSTLADSAKGLYYVVSAGFQGAGAINVLRYAMMAAKASGADLADVAHGVAGALNAYGLKASDASKVTDIMTAAVTDGMQTYQEFAHEMGMATAVAAAHKVPLLQLAAAEASITDKGLPAAAAFAGLAFAIAKVMVPAAEMGAKVRAAGGSFDEAKWSAMGLVDRLNYLDHATGITQTEFTKLIGGTRSSKAALDLVNDGGKKYAEVLAKMGSQAGITAAAFKVHDRTMGAAFEDVKGAISNAAYELVKMATPAVTSGLVLIAQLAGKLPAAFQAVGNAIAFVKTHFDVIGPILAGIAAGALVFAATSIPALVAGFGAWATAAAAAAIATIAATWPILAVAAGVGLLVAAIIYAYIHWTGFRNLVQTVGTALANFAGVVKNVTGDILGFFGNLPGRIGTFMGAALGAVGSFVGGVLGFFGSLPGKVGALIGNFFNLIGTTMRNGWNAIIGIVSGAINTVISWFMTAYNHSYLFKAIVDLIVADFNIAKKFVTEVWTATVTFLGTQWNNLKALASAAWNVITGVIQTDLNLAKSIITGVWTAIMGFLGGVWAWIQNTARSAWNGFVAIIQADIGLAKTAVTNIVNGIKGVFSPLAGDLLKIGQQIIAGLIAGIKSMLGAVGAAIGQVVNAVKGGITQLLGIHSPSKVFMEYGAAMGQGLILGLAAQNVAARVKGIIGGIPGGAPSTLGGPSGGLFGGSSGAIMPSFASGSFGSAAGASGRDIVIHVHPHVNLDGRELAQKLLPHEVAIIRIATGMRI